MFWHESQCNAALLYEAIEETTKLVDIKYNFLEHLKENRNPISEFKALACGEKQILTKRENESFSKKRIPIDGKLS